MDSENIKITEVDNTALSGVDAVFKGETLSVAGAVTLPVGTLLARDSVSLKLVTFVKGGVSNENGIPKAVLTSEVVATGAGDFSIRPQVSGQCRFSQLIIAADADNSNIDAAVSDQLRDYGIIDIVSNQLSGLDNNL